MLGQAEDEPGGVGLSCRRLPWERLHTRRVAQSHLTPDRVNHALCRRKRNQALVVRRHVGIFPGVEPRPLPIPAAHPSSCAVVFSGARPRGQREVVKIFLSALEKSTLLLQRTSQDRH